MNKQQEIEELKKKISDLEKLQEKMEKGEDYGPLVKGLKDIYWNPQTKVITASVITGILIGLAGQLNNKLRG